MGGEEGYGHAGGEGDICGEGVVATAEEVGDGAYGDHAERDGGEGAAEEAHGVSGEVVEVAEGEVVEVGVVGEEGREICAGGDVWGEDGEVSADGRDEGGERKQEVERPA